MLSRGCRGAAALIGLMAAASVTVAAAHEPPAVSALAARVLEAPADSDARFALAREYARAGRFAEAEGEYDRLLAVAPANADFLLGKATVLLARERPRDALPLLGKARALAPAYEDVWRVEVSALEASGDARGALELLEAAQRQFPGAVWPAARAARLRTERLEENGTRLSAAAAYESLSGAATSWTSTGLMLDRPLSASTRIAGGLAREERFGVDDLQVSLGFVHRISPVWSVELGAEVAPDAEFLPERVGRLELSRPLGRATSVGLRARHSSYESVRAFALAAYAERAFAAAWRLGYTLTATEVTDTDAKLAHAVRIARDYGAGSHVTVLMARGDEAEPIAPGRVLVMRTNTLAVTGLHWRTAAWGLAWSLSWTEQGELYERLGVRLGVEHRF